MTAAETKELTDLRNWKEAAVLERQHLRDLMAKKKAHPNKQLHAFVGEYIDKQAARIAKLETQLAEAQKKASVHDWVLERLVRMGAVL